MLLKLKKFVGVRVFLMNLNAQMDGNPKNLAIAGLAAEITTTISLMNKYLLP
jgi:hypothetical protein